MLSDQREINAGPFELQDLPVVTGSGEVRLVVRDALGRETLTTQSFLGDAAAPWPGLHDFCYEIGFSGHRKPETGTDDLFEQRLPARRDQNLRITHTGKACG